MHDPNESMLLVLGRVVLMWLFPLLLLPLMIWFERKASAFMQDRTGPNRAAIAGMRLAGIVHTMADVLKLLGKEIITPSQVQRGYYRLAPLVAIVVSQILFAVVPFADSVPVRGGEVFLQALRLDVGILYPLAAGSMFVYSIILAGWASNSKFGVLGGLRAAAQTVSYEVAMGLSVVGALMIYGTMDLNEMVRQQGQLLGGWLPRWGIVMQPVGALLFLTAAFAETSRTPFDMPERDAEIVAGYHTEYSGLGFGFFFMSEYIHIVVASGLVATLFFGGWQVPWFPTEALRAHAATVLDVLLAGLALVGAGAAVLSLRWSPALRRLYGDARRNEGVILAAGAGAAALVGLAALVALHGRELPGWAPPAIAAVAQFSAFAFKTVCLAFGFIWVRWTLPSFRYDQLMRLGWKNLMPLALVNIAVTGVVLLLLHPGAS